MRILQKEDFIKDVATRIVLIAKKKFGSQKEFAKAIKVNETTISRWVKGENTPDLYTLYTICNVAHISLDYLVLGKSFDNEEISPDLFDEVYFYTYKWASEENKISTSGSFFLGVYEMVKQELKKGNKESVEEIINNLKPTILKLRK